MILAEGGSFPTDLYVAEGVAATRPGVELRLEAGRPAIEALIDEDIAVVLVNHVDYRTGARRDVAGADRAGPGGRRGGGLGSLPLRGAWRSG